MPGDDLRCPWCLGDPQMEAYHDREWGVPVYDERKLFEFLMLEGFQAGLSWRTILHKRENFRKAFDFFDAEKIARYDDAKLEALRHDAGIVRNRLKIAGAVKNARAFLRIREEEDSFSRFIWQFTNGRVIQNHWKTMSEIPPRSDLSDRMAKGLKARGFTFCGSSITYAFMQASGLVNDHLVSCPVHRALL